jgi:hypothetical protein
MYFFIHILVLFAAKTNNWVDRIEREKETFKLKISRMLDYFQKTYNRR